MQTRRCLYFTAPQSVEVREEPLAAPGEGQVLVEARISAVSAGTELLVYRGQFPDLPVDASIAALSRKFAYPLAYGYACVGEVVEAGPGVGSGWIGRQVFSFQPHCSHFVAGVESLHCLPAGMPAETACFLPNTETAVNLVQDAAPILGERVLVLGQGIIGLLAGALLAEFPLGCLVCVDPIPARREAALALGAHAALDPYAEDFLPRAFEWLKNGADLTLELSGSPAVLNSALALTAFSGRIVIGSWYGQKQAPVDLGGSFHRSRIRMISSQVSTIAPELSGRWDKARRFETAWRALERIRPEKWITQSYHLEDAAQAYSLMDENPSGAIQVVFRY